MGDRRAVPAADESGPPRGRARGGARAARRGAAGGGAAFDEAALVEAGAEATDALAEVPRF